MNAVEAALMRTKGPGDGDARGSFAPAEPFSSAWAVPDAAASVASLRAFAWPEAVPPPAGPVAAPPRLVTTAGARSPGPERHEVTTAPPVPGSVPGSVPAAVPAAVSASASASARASVSAAAPVSGLASESAAARSAVHGAALVDTSLPDVPRMAAEFHARVVTSPATSSESVEQYRKLAAMLHQQHRNSAMGVLMITSAVAHEGKSLTAINLALTLACSYGRSVLLVDADLRRPSLDLAFDRPASSGLHEHLLSGEPPHVIRLARQLTLLPAGRVNPDPTGVLSSARLRPLIEDAAARYDWVVIDTPPVALLPDAQLLIDMVDAVLIVVKAGETDYGLALRAVEIVGRERVLGVVLNRVDASPVSSAYADGYRHRG